MRVPLRLIIGILLGATVLGATYWYVDPWPASTPIEAPRRADAATEPPSTTGPPTTLATAPPTTTTAPTGLALPLTPRPARVAWAGDSVAASLADAVIAAAGARGVEVLNHTTPGCGMVRGLAADDDLVPIPFVRACDAGVGQNLASIAASGPDVVTWLSTWETANRLVDGRGMVFGTPEGDAILLALVDESAQRLTAGGARLVLLTMAPSTTGPNRPVVPEEDTRRALHLDELLRQYAAAHADRVAVLDLAALVCPTGPPCPTEVEGVTLRPVDGGHFAGDGPAWVAPRVLDRLLGPG